MGTFMKKLNTCQTRVYRQKIILPHAEMSSESTSLPQKNTLRAHILDLFTPKYW